MRLLWISLSVLWLLVQLPFGGSPPEPPEDVSPVKGWWMVSYFATPPTTYSEVRKGVIKAESGGSRSSLFKTVSEREATYSILTWKWRISNTVRSAIETRKDRFDAAACVMVVFGEEKSFRPVKKGEPSGLKIEYIWATRLPREHLFDHPGESNSKVIVLESGERKAGQWIFESRNIQKDFETAFGIASPHVVAIGIQTDTDHSNERVTAFYTKPVLKKK